MAEQEKTYRTAAYHAEDRRTYDFRYWVMSPAYKKPGFQIKEHEVGTNSGLTSRIVDGISEHEALLKMAELERTAAAKFRKVDDDNENNLRKLGNDYKNAEPVMEHAQAFIAEMNSARLKLRQKNPGLKLKP